MASRRWIDPPCSFRPTHEYLWPPEQLADPIPCLGRREALAGLELPILPNADTDPPGCATDSEALTLPTALHHPRVRGKVDTFRSLGAIADLVGYPASRYRADLF